MLLRQVVNHITIGGMYIYKAAMFFYFFHQANHLPVVNHQSTFVSHKCFKRSNAFFFYKMFYFFFCILIKIRNCHVKTIITHTIIIAPAFPFCQCSLQTVTLFLQNKIYQHSSTTIQCSTGAGFIAIAAVGSHKRHI